MNVFLDHVSRSLKTTDIILDNYLLLALANHFAYDEPLTETVKILASHSSMDLLRDNRPLCDRLIVAVEADHNLRYHIAIAARYHEGTRKHWPMWLRNRFGKYRRAKEKIASLLPIRDKAYNEYEMMRKLSVRNPLICKIHKTPLPY